jgi:hypothetical protein
MPQSTPEHCPTSVATLPSDVPVYCPVCKTIPLQGKQTGLAPVQDSAVDGDAGGEAH